MSNAKMTLVKEAEDRKRRITAGCGTRAANSQNHTELVCFLWKESIKISFIIKISAKLLGYMVLSLALAVSAMAQAESPDGPILFTNVNVFDGVSDKLIMKDGKIYKNTLE